MIADKDRSGWFGASDTRFITGNWETKTFQKWWLVKMGIRTENFTNVYTQAGTEFEHRIMESLNLHIIKDEQYIIDDLLLRVNLDGRVENTDYEVKTYRYEKGFKVSRAYWEQVQVQMYAAKLNEAYIVAYGLTDKDYKNYLRLIDNDRLELIPIERDENFINNIYLPRLEELVKCLKNGKFPEKII